MQIGAAVSLGPTSAGRLVALSAAAAPAGSQDAVDLALVAETQAYYGEVPMPGVVVASFEPAVPTRRYSVTRVRELKYPDGMEADELFIMRGDLRSVIGAARLGPDRRLLLNTNASYVERRGYRPLAVASAPVGADDAPGIFEVHGFVPVRTSRAKGFRGDVIGRTQEWVRVPVWPATLRWLHWLNVLAIVVLTVTGFYIAGPYLSPGGGQRTGFFMGWVRFVHFAVAYCWVTVGLIRVYLLFYSRNRFVRWPALWPLKGRQDIRHLGRTISAYLLIHPDEAPTYIAHNPLQQLTYTAIYGMAALQAVTGFAIYGLYNSHQWFWALFHWPVTLLGAPDVRLIHYVIMWLFWVFLILHIYLAVRADTLERHGGLSSMISGGIWLRKGSRPVDDPSL
jgi:Ni/Fe-hydrogenase b-type cytochrome subunit